ncbi:hypothetical protein [Zavarzinella formosa]|uniref:hypothetical protein n=1 Tax=Zavarzinella formosa TaxID=360055 RepID=UPI0003158B5A|nr:hypothetical protein [Zavarzinella formosa]
MGIGVLLVLVGYLGVTAFQNGHFRPDTPQIVAAVLLGLLAAAGVVWRIFFNHRSGVRS